MCLKDWKITFYTGDKIWAGTDSELALQINGENDFSRPILIIPRKSQLEIQSVDTFPIKNIDAKRLGKIKSITISKQHSYAFFNDWQLLKA